VRVVAMRILPVPVGYRIADVQSVVMYVQEFLLFSAIGVDLVFRCVYTVSWEVNVER